MSSINPYAPPTAAVADVLRDDAEVGTLRLFSARGRVNRLRYLAWLTGGYFVSAIGWALCGALTAVSPALGGLATFAVSIVVLVIGALWNIQRAHDMGWSGWSCLAMIIPLVALVWVFKPGAAGRNAYGAPPPPNTTGVKILGGLFPLIFVLGIVAAIALPAYQDYTRRAHAAQSGHV